MGTERTTGRDERTEREEPAEATPAAAQDPAAPEPGAEPKKATANGGPAQSTPPQSQPDPEPEPEAEPKAQPDPEPEPDPEPDSGAQRDPEPEDDGEPEPEPEPDPEPDPGAQRDPEPEDDGEPEPEPDSGADDPQPAAAETEDGPEAGCSEDAPAEGGTQPEPRPETTGRQRLVAALWPPRLSRSQLIVALLLFTLGLGLAIQVRTTNDTDQLRGARHEDLVRILDELDDRTTRLEEEKRQLEDQRTELKNSSNQAAEARRQTEKKAQQLGVLAGSVGAEGPGITLTINDPGGHVRADMLLDTLQELRAAGAEAIQINDVRVVADTHFSDEVSSGGVEIDGSKVSQPYRFQVIGNPQDLQPALNIPGGVVQTLEKEQATVGVVRSEKIVVDALRQVKEPDYARSGPE